MMHKKKGSRYLKETGENTRLVHKPFASGFRLRFESLDVLGPNIQLWCSREGFLQVQYDALGPNIQFFFFKIRT